MQSQSCVTIAEMAAASLAAVRVFERLGIDYCCNAKRSLAEVCREKGLDANVVQSEVDAAAGARKGVDRDWATAPLRDLADHIVNTHHEYLKREFQPLAERVENVYRVYNERYGPTLTGLPEVYAGLRSELEMHMVKEERILFPAIVAAESAAASGAPPPRTPFGPVANPIGMMEAEHDNAAQALAQIRLITGAFAIPDYACETFSALITGLHALEQDLHLHIHLENNILFPRAIELERSRR